jgi:protein O-mannosyl-transferase
MKKYRSFITGCLLFLVIGACYYPSLKIRYIWDDKVSVETNPYLVRVDINTFFTNPEASFPHGNNEIYRPLRTVYLALIRHFFGPEPFTFHALSILLHFFVCLLIFCYLRLRFSEFIALITSFLFAVHPVHSESLNLVVGSADLLCAFFLLFALLANQMPSNRKGSYVAIFLLLALFSKESGIVGLPLIWLDDYWKDNKTLKGLFLNLKTIFCLGITAAYLLLRWSITGRVAQLGHHGETWMQHLNFGLQGLITYLRILFWPYGLKLDYIFSYDHFFLTLLMFSAIILGIVWIFKKDASPCIFRFAFLWFFICYLPIANIIPIKTVVSERLLYLPSLGFCLFCAVIVEKWIQRKKSWPAFLIIFLVLVLGSSTWIRNREWIDEDEFWRLNLLREPFSARANANYAIRMVLKKDYPSAERLLERSVALNPNEAAFRNGLERVRQEKKRNT